mgnify:CR=1 FL=1
MKRMLKRILVVLLVLILLAVAGFGVLYAGRLRTGKQHRADHRV